MSRPVFTIVTVSYNAVAVIEKTILSVIDQHYPELEYIIVDGGSKDGTIDVVKKYEANISKWISEPDKGIYDAMNKAIRMATGDWINFMNAGDVFYSNSVLNSIAGQISDESTVVFGDMAMDINGYEYIELSDPFYDHLPLNHKLGFNHQATFVRTEAAKRHPFNLRFKLAADYNMIITLYREGCVFQQINKVFVKFDTTGAAKQKLRLHLYETLCVDDPSRIIYNMLMSYVLFVRTKTNGYMKKVLFKIAPSMTEKILRKNLPKFIR